MKSAAKTRTKAAPKKSKTVKAAVSCAHGLREAPADQCFWVNFGPVVKDLEELRIALRGMTDEQFHYHATTRGVNDFALWIEGVLGHIECARKIERAKTRESAARALASCKHKR